MATFYRQFTVRQTITAGQQFTGAASGGALTQTGDLLSYATSAAGGLIMPHSEGTFTPEAGPMTCSQIIADFGGVVTTFKLDLVDVSGNAYNIITDVTGIATGFAILGADAFAVPVGWGLRLITTGSVTAMNVAATFERGAS